MSPGIPGPVARFISLLLTPFYLVLLAAILSRSTNMMMVVATGIVVGGATAICVLLKRICSGISNKGPTKSRFSIHMLLLGTTVIAIQLAYIRKVFQDFRFESLDFVGSAGLVMTSVLFMAVTTIILLRFIDSLTELIKIFNRIFFPDAEQGA